MSRPATRGTYRKDYISPRRDGSGFQYKRAVPERLQSLIGRTAWTRWLGNKGRGCAEQQARELAVEHDRLIASLSTLSAAEYQQIADAGGLAAWQAQRALDDRMISAPTGGFFTSTGPPATVRSGDAEIIFTRLFAEHVEPDPEMPDHMQAETLLEVHRAKQRVIRFEAEAAAAKRLARKIEGGDEAPGALSGLVPLWQKFAKPRAAKSIDKANMHVRRYVAALGDHTPREVTRQHAIAYREALEKEFSAANVDKHLYGMHRLFAVAMSEGVADFNPFSGVKARKADNGKFVDDGKKPFTSDQAATVFARLAELSADDQMVMRILAYHGMRAGEVCQLRACDVKRVGGVDVISINDTAGSIKNRASLRDVPVHPKCRDLLKLAKSKAPDDYLFDYPAWKHSRAGKFQQRSGAWLRKIGITDKKVTVHSWRHTWRTLARDLNMPEPVSRAILGHTQGKGEHGKYGEGPAMKTRAQWIAKIAPLNG